MSNPENNPDQKNNQVKPAAELKKIDPTKYEDQKKARENEEIQDKFSSGDYVVDQLFDGNDERMFNFLHENYMNDKIFTEPMRNHLKAQIQEYWQRVDGVTIHGDILLRPNKSITGRKIIDAYVNGVLEHGGIKTTLIPGDYIKLVCGEYTLEQQEEKSTNTSEELSEFK